MSDNESRFKDVMCESGSVVKVKKSDVLYTREGQLELN